MKDPFVQALLCILTAAGLYVLAGHAPANVHDGIVALAGSVATLWINLPRKGKTGSVPRSSGVPLLCLVLAVGAPTACSSTSRQAQLNVTEVATQAANELGQGMLQMYGLQLAHCVEESTNEMEYNICKMSVDQVWGKARLAYASLRRTQDLYASALERSEMNAADFLEWFRISFCELKDAAPPELVLPPAPGLTCGDAQ